MRVGQAPQESCLPNLRRELRRTKHGSNAFDYTFVQCDLFKKRHYFDTFWERVYGIDITAGLRW